MSTSRHTAVTPCHHTDRVNNQDHPCPQCGGAAAKRIVWTEDASIIGTTHDPAVRFLNGPPAWNDSSGPDLICSACEKRFWSDPSEQEKDEENARRQQRRIEAMNRGEYMLFDPRTTSADEIAHTVWQQIQRSQKAAAKAASAEKSGAKKRGDEKNEAAD